jgi:acyl-CoA synthetase (AMP-forming)/AMP-acid ligase II
MYTSGTTSRPKGVTHTYDNVQWKNAAMVGPLGLHADDRLLVSGPLYHAGAGELPGWLLLVLGGSLCILRDFSAAAALDAIDRHNITGAWWAPVMISAVLSEPGGGDRDWSSLRWVTGGGDRTPEPRIRAFADKFPNARFVDAYGLTETCAGDTLMEPGREIEKIGSTGRAVPYVDIEIRDEAGRPLPADAEGEICLRGPKVTRGYWRDDEATRAAFHADGWFRSGDVGRLDGEGFLYLTDRQKDLIISGGENVSPSEVERVVDELPEVAEAAVIGVADDKWGEVPAAVVVLRDAARLDLDTLAAHCRQRLAGFKVPKALYLRDALPRNASGKILKRVLRDDYGQS